jgi:hypothetical protein
VRERYSAAKASHGAHVAEREAWQRQNVALEEERDQQGRDPLLAAEDAYPDGSDAVRETREQS